MTLGVPEWMSSEKRTFLFRNRFDVSPYDESKNRIRNELNSTVQSDRAVLSSGLSYLVVTSGDDRSSLSCYNINTYIIRNGDKVNN